MEHGARNWVLRKIVLKDKYKSSGFAWIHLPTETAYVVKSEDFGKSMADRVHYLHDALPRIFRGDWEYAE